jgi:very-short-patch-repair endonuclease
VRGYARANRRQSTDAEARLWSRLRDRRLGGWKFRRQYPVGNAILDFYCPGARLAIELDGGGHATETSIAYDTYRSEWLASEGIRVLRFWNDQVLVHMDTTLELILEALEASKRTSPLTPTLSPTGERGKFPVLKAP